MENNWIYSSGMELNIRIRELRQARGMTLAQLAEQVNISVPHLSEIERGKKNLNNHLMTRLADALNVHPADLIAQDDQARELIKIIDDLSEGDRQRILDFASALKASQKDS